MENNQVEVLKYLVVACTKLFFARAPEMQGILSGVYKQVLRVSTDADLRQRVMFYYKLMSTDINTAQTIICKSIINT